eukprot:TRINITY_DN12933_c0_g1_i1.p1 TRINITY_DN12933_c0_g1~~TRINITY_DN12933_c0_g1_i1.p1  ORF type:complete len:365 (-),score=33.17 TRINITY_DN12933_c0_g1_i1:177-1271(-)
MFFASERHEEAEHSTGWEHSNDTSSGLFAQLHRCVSPSNLWSDKDQDDDYYDSSHDFSALRADEDGCASSLMSSPPYAMARQSPATTTAASLRTARTVRRSISDTHADSDDPIQSHSTHNSHTRTLPTSPSVSAPTSPISSPFPSPSMFSTHQKLTSSPPSPHNQHMYATYDPASPFHQSPLMRSALYSIPQHATHNYNINNTTTNHTNSSSISKRLMRVTSVCLRNERLRTVLIASILVVMFYLAWTHSRVDSPFNAISYDVSKSSILMLPQGRERRRGEPIVEGAEGTAAMISSKSYTDQQRPKDEIDAEYADINAVDRGRWCWWHDAYEPIYPYRYLRSLGISTWGIVVAVIANQHSCPGC